MRRRLTTPSTPPVGRQRVFRASNLRQLFNEPHLDLAPSGIAPDGCIHRTPLVLGRALFSESAGASDYICHLVGCSTDDFGCVVSASTVVEGLLNTRQVADDVPEGFGGSGFETVDVLALRE